MSITHSSHYSFSEAFVNNELNFDSPKKFDNFHRHKKRKKDAKVKKCNLLEYLKLVSSEGLYLGTYKSCYIFEDHI